jgi:hypothetical protein
MSDAFEAVVAALAGSDGRGTNRTILVDEAHYLENPRCFDTLRRASDRGRVGLVIVYNAEKYQGRGRSRTMLLNTIGYTQFERRVVCKLRISADSITENDLRLVLGQAIPEDVLSETLPVLLQEAHNNGGIGRCATLVQNARMNAGRQPLKAKHIYRVLEALSGSEE